MLKNKISLVTGGGSGIGFQIAKRFLEEGSDVILLDYKPQSLTAAAAKLKDLGKEPSITTYTCDVSCGNEVKNTAEEIKGSVGRVDVLVNSAGITDDAFMNKMSLEQWDRVMSINLRGPFLMSKELSSIMSSEQKENKDSGSIINISSIVGKVGNLGQSNYSASKGGLVSLTKTTAKEFAKYNIRCNAVLPGFIQTPMLDSVPDKVKNQIRAQIPLQQLGTPQDISNTCVFLASSQSSYITGTTIEVTGGLFC